MTLPELAALAEKVKGFERPTAVVWSPTPPRTSERVPDNSPAALLMAVFEYQLKGNRKLETDRGDILIRRGDDWVRVKAGETQEGIARAALVALLRAHGVEVADDPR